MRDKHVCIAILLFADFTRRNANFISLRKPRVAMYNAKYKSPCISVLVKMKYERVYDTNLLFADVVRRNVVAKT